MNEKTAIILTTFGTAVPKAFKVFDYILEFVRKAFPEVEVRLALNFPMIRDRLREQGVEVDCLPDVILALKAESFCRFVIQPLKLVPGRPIRVDKYRSEGMQVVVGEILLEQSEDFEPLIDLLKIKFRGDFINVVVAHGNEKQPEKNEPLFELKRRLEKRFNNVTLRTIEGPPGFDDLAGLKADKVNFIFLLITAGFHAMNDVMGDGERSWKNLVSPAEVSCSDALGYSPEFLALFLPKIRTALQKLENSNE